MKEVLSLQCSFPPGKHLSSLTTQTLETSIWVYLSTRILWIYSWPKKVTGFNWWRWRGPWRNEDQRAVIERDNLNLSEFVSRPVVAIGQRCYLLWQMWNRKAVSTGGKTAVVFSCSFVLLLIYHHQGKVRTRYIFNELFVTLYWTLTLNMLCKWLHIS